MNANPAKAAGPRIVGLGRIAERDVWRERWPGSSFVELPSATPSGLRWDSRVLGIGVDALRVALKVRLQSGHEPTLALNPWIAVACRATGIRSLAATGIYAAPASRSWRMLWRALRDVPIVATSRVEADAWAASGGVVRAVRWGGRTAVGLSRETEVVPQVFIGGTSDRDIAQLNRLLEEVRASSSKLRIVIADGSGPKKEVIGNSEVVWLPYISRAEFLQNLQSSNVSFIPLRDSGRAAGHMVLSASLEAGLPTFVTRSAGMEEYLEVPGPTPWCWTEPLVPRLIESAAADEPARFALRKCWFEHFSNVAYIRDVSAALIEMGWGHV